MNRIVSKIPCVYVLVLLTGFAWGQTGAAGGRGATGNLQDSGAQTAADQVGGSGNGVNLPVGTVSQSKPSNSTTAVNSQPPIAKGKKGLSDPEPDASDKLPEVPLEDILKKVAESARPKAAEAQGGLTRYWKPRYHPQVTRQVFDLIHYPYFPGGKPFSLRPADPNEYDDGRQLVQELTGQPVGEPNLPALDQAGPIKPIQAIGTYERCMDLVYQWRSLNESRENALEIVRSIELSRTQTKIYQTQPRLAIGVKRTLGQIGLINIHFDQTCRTVVQMLIAGEDPRPILARLDKQLADLASQFDRLILQNDQISVALGMGAIDRRHVAFDEPIRFINISSLEDKKF